MYLLNISSDFSELFEIFFKGNKIAGKVKEIKSTNEATYSSHWLNKTICFLRRNQVCVFLFQWVIIYRQQNAQVVIKQLQWPIILASTHLKYRILSSSHTVPACIFSRHLPNEITHLYYRSSFSHSRISYEWKYTACSLFFQDFLFQHNLVSSKYLFMRIRDNRNVREKAIDSFSDWLTKGSQSQLWQSWSQDPGPPFRSPIGPISWCFPECAVAESWGRIEIDKTCKFSDMGWGHCKWYL